MWPWLIYSLSLAWFGLIFRAIWRSAGSYRGPKIWGALARLGVLAGALRMTAEAGVLLAFNEITSGRKADEGAVGANSRSEEDMSSPQTERARRVERHRP
jgi:hypothetical protein